MDAPVSPLAKKLKLKPGLRAAAVGAPPGYLERLDAPAGTTIATSLTWSAFGLRPYKPGGARQTFR